MFNLVVVRVASFVRGHTINGQLFGNSTILASSKQHQFHRSHPNVTLFARTHVFHISIARFLLPFVHFFLLFFTFHTYHHIKYELQIVCILCYCCAQHNPFAFDSLSSCQWIAFHFWNLKTCRKCSITILNDGRNQEKIIRVVSMALVRFLGFEPKDFFFLTKRI